MECVSRAVSILEKCIVDMASGKTKKIIETSCNVEGCFAEGRGDLAFILFLKRVLRSERVED